MEPNTNVGKSNNVWMWVVVVLVIIAIAFMMMNKKDDGELSVESGENSETAMDADDVATLPEGQEDTTEGSIKATTPTAVTLSYQQALEQYKDKRIQFDNSCATTPKTVTYKDNTGIMLDNRSATTRTIKVGATYTVKGYGFKIITLPDTYLQSKTLLVDCDGQQNVATVLVQE